MQQLQRDGVALAYEEAGAGGPPLVLLHGIACDHAYMAPQFEAFRHTRRVVNLDLRGHGTSAAPPGDYSIPAFAEDVVWLCRALGVYRPVIVGHSMGGMITLEIAARYPNFATAIVMLDATVVPPLGTDGFLAPVTQGIHSRAWAEVLRQFMAFNFGPQDDSQRKARILDAVTTTPQHVVVATWDGLLAWDSAVAAAGCRVPALYVDSGTPNADLARFATLCPHLVTGKTVGSGHFLELEVPDQVNPMIARFLAGLPTAAATSALAAAPA